MLEVETKTGFAALVGKRMSKEVVFCGEKIKINKLSVAEVKAIQALAQSLEKEEEAGFDVLRTIIQSAVDGADKVEPADFEKFPMEELSKLSNEIMKYSGIGQDQGK